MKIIDLLNKIANGEEVPKKIKFDSQIWQKENGGRNNIYYVNDINYDLFVIVFRSNGTYSINDEVEIIEEDKKIENLKKIDIYRNETTGEGYLIKTKYMCNEKVYLNDAESELCFIINELIDVIKDLKGSDD